MLKGRNYRPVKLSRRQFLDGFGAAALGTALRPGLAHALLASPQQPAFQEVPASKSKIDWAHVAGLSSEMYLPETVGAGCAFLDYDNDGWMDIYLVNSGPCDFYKPSKPLRNALYRNNRDGTFTDVTEKAGIPGNAYGMGVAVGDYDGDGLPDMYVTQYPNSILYHNNGDGTLPMSQQKPESPLQAGLQAQSGSTMTMMVDSIFSSAALPISTDRKMSIAAAKKPEQAITASLTCTNRWLRGSSIITAMALLPM